MSWADGKEDPGDIALLRLAAEEDRILITIDSDFGTLVYLLGAHHAGIIRLPDAPAATRIGLMANLLERYGEGLSGAIVTIRGDRIRISGGAAEQ
jgi:predicted nuclease of predicted toxin-antitoxin system